MLTPNQLRAEIVARRTYQRPLNEEGTKFESWKDVCHRVVWNHQRWLWERALGRSLNNEEKAELRELEGLLFERKALLAGRTLWLGGTDTAKTREVSQVNCTAVEVKNINDVVDVFWLLLNGCGVGFKPIKGTLNGFKHPIKNIQVKRTEREKNDKGRPSNVETFEEGVWTIGIGDSGEAWAKSIGKLLSGKYDAHTLVFDFSEVRGAGGRLKGYGWVSSGDEVISEVYPKIASLLSRKAGQLLDEMDILDLINYLGVIQTGRRGAEIAFLDYGSPNWEKFARAKKDFWLHDNHHRTQSNNSLLFNVKPSRKELEHLFEIIMESGGSEPGFINLQELKRRAPYATLANPCVTGDTLILTTEGNVPIKDCVGESVAIWNGEDWSRVRPFSTGINTIYKVSLSDGSELKCTGYHEWVLHGGERRKTHFLEAGDKLAKFEMPLIVVGVNYPVDAYSQGFYSGDGTTGYARSNLYKPKYVCMNRLVGSFGEDKGDRRSWKHGPMMSKQFVPINGTKQYCLDWLAGLLDADGTVTRDANGNGLQITAIDKKFLHDVKMMLVRLGVRAKIAKGNPEGLRTMPDGQGGSKDYFCQTTYRLSIGNTDTYNLVTMGLICERLDVHGNPPQRDARRFVTVETVELLDKEEETFCFNEPLTHRGTFNGIVTGQCVEILLPDAGICNLCTLNIAAFESLVEAQRAYYIIGRANYRQTLMNLDDGILQIKWHQTNQFLRLCGISMMGVAMRPLTDFDLKGLRNSGVAGAMSMAFELGTELPKNITTQKPEGTAAKIAGCTEGIHKPLGRYIFNNITFSKHEPIVEKLRSHGYRVFDNPSQPDGVVVTFPVSWDTVEGFVNVNGTDINLETAVEQLDRYKRFMREWTEQNSSITVSYSPDEIPSIIDWFEANWDDYVGVSFILRADPTKTAEDLGYLYLPQEVVSKEKYEEYVSKLVHFSLDDLKETGGVEDIDFLDSSCEQGVCPVR